MPDKLALEAADQVQFAIQWANRHSVKIAEAFEFEKQKAKIH
jgi:hypothetical protein